MRIHDELAISLARSGHNLADLYFYKSGGSDVERVPDAADSKAKLLEILEDRFSTE